jgi:hypothetical protein
MGLAGMDIDLLRAWEITTGHREVIVGVIDTGVDFSSPDLRDNAWVNEAELNGKPGVDDDGNGYIDDLHGFDFLNNKSEVIDDNGHGTHVAGVIGARGNNGFGIAGINWNIRIMSLKFLGAEGSGDLASALKAIRYATKMGAKITVDSATLMNKGLEAIEAHHLFGVPMSKIHILIHPQSIVHSLVEFNDGAMLAQLSHPDMRLPIQYALTHPARSQTKIKRLELEDVKRLDFAAPDFSRFSCLRLALLAGEKGGTAPVALSSANEEAVRAFIDERISFMTIPAVVSHVLKKNKVRRNPTLKDVLSVDTWARKEANSFIDTFTKRKK